MISQKQIEDIRSSWALVLPVGHRAGELFYQNLFVHAPELRPLFPADISRQAGKLISMLGMVVASLDRLEAFVPQLQTLAIRHRDYGTQPAHYDAVGHALLQTLQQELGSSWTACVEEAWRTAYQTLAQVMIDAQTQASPQASS
jgi:methyl-accepting chemotaxis protein